MTDALPSTPNQLRWILARRLSAAGLVIALLAGGTAYLLEARRTEQAALERATAAAGHFASPAMQLLLANGGADGHVPVKRLLDRSHFVGIRIFDRHGQLAYESWESVPSSFIEAAKSHRHEWPAVGESHRNWIEVAGERLIQVVLPLDGDQRGPAGYLEGIYRLDQENLRHQQQQVRDGALAAAASVFATATLLYPLLLAMLRRSTGLSRRLLQANLSLMRSLGNAVAKRDSDTDAHNYRVTLYAVALAETMGIPAGEIPDLVTGAFLHDVGKIGIPDQILRKPGRLTSDEFEIMKTHACLGLDIVAGNPWLEGAACVIRHHHERFDGTGYPDGLAGAAIPRLARIFAVVDVFDALTSARPYKAAMPLAESLSILDEESGRHFDPDAVTAFRQIAPALYGRMAQVDEAALHQEMHTVLTRYFKMP